MLNCPFRRIRRSAGHAGMDSSRPQRPARERARAARRRRLLPVAWLITRPAGCLASQYRMSRPEACARGARSGHRGRRTARAHRAAAGGRPAGTAAAYGQPDPGIRTLFWKAGVHDRHREVIVLGGPRGELYLKRVREPEALRVGVAAVRSRDRRDHLGGSACLH